MEDIAYLEKLHTLVEARRFLELVIADPKIEKTLKATADMFQVTYHLTELITELGVNMSIKKFQGDLWDKDQTSSAEKN